MTRYFVCKLYKGEVKPMRLLHDDMGNAEANRERLLAKYPNNEYEIRSIDDEVLILSSERT